MKSLEELKSKLLADGIIDLDEANELEKLLFADGKIDSEEAEFIFAINDAVSGKSNDVAWNKLFVKAIASFCWMMKIHQEKLTKQNLIGCTIKLQETVKLMPLKRSCSCI